MKCVYGTLRIANTTRECKAATVWPCGVSLANKTLSEVDRYDWSREEGRGVLANYITIMHWKHQLIYGNGSVT